MLQVQEAVRNSLNAFEQVFDMEEMKEVRLEEVTLSSDEKFWLVTVSYLNPDYESELKSKVAQSSGLERMMGTQREFAQRRITKTIKLRSHDGSLIGITN